MFKGKSFKNINRLVVLKKELKNDSKQSIPKNIYI